MSQIGTCRNQIFNGVIENVLDLKLILVILMTFAQLAKLIGEIEAFAEVLGSDKVKRDFDAIVNVDYLMRRTGWDENCITFVLDDSITVDSLLFEALSERCIDVPILENIQTVEITQKNINKFKLT